MKTIGIVSLSAGTLGESFVSHELAIGVTRLESLGCKVKFLPNALKGIAYLKAHPEKRAQDLLEAYRDPEIDMILCAIGGDDTYRLLPYLFGNDELKKVVSNKPFLGFSDTTVNHFMLHKLGIPTFYGQSFLADVCELEKGMLPFSWRIRNMAEIAHDAGFVGGKFSIQSESSMMVCLAAAPKNGMQILDACAAPGGKSCLLAEMMQGTGRVQAWELHPHRADLIAAQVQRLGLENVRPMTRDALKRREELDGTMDIVLLDAPCSGLGVMSEKPDVKYRVTAQSVDELVRLQSDLLDAVCPYVKKGGTLVYSTCSVLKDENVRQAEKFLARHPEFELLPLPETIPAQVRQYETTGLQLLPQRDGIEGFYMCRMRRKKA